MASTGSSPWKGLGRGRGKRFSLGGACHPRPWSVRPGTWVTVLSGDMGNTCSAGRFGLSRKAGVHPRLAADELSGEVDVPELDRAIADLPVPGFGFAQANGLTNQCLAEENEPALPL